MAFAMAMLLLAGTTSRATDIATWGPTGWTGTAASPLNAGTPSGTVNANLSSAQLSRSGLGSSSSTVRHNSTTWSTGGNYLAVTLTAANGFVLNLNGATLIGAWGSSGTGPTGYSVYSSVDNYTTAIGTFTSSTSGQTANQPITLPASAYNALSTITFRIAGTGSSGGTGGPSYLSVGGSVAAVGGGGPAAPTANAATATNSSSFTASWNTSSGATGYKLDVATSSDFSTGLILNAQDIPGGSTVSYLVANLNAGIAYHYRVRAYNGSGVSGNSGIIDVTTLAPAAYTWVATAGFSDWTAAASWSPTRTTPNATDILLFNQGGNSTATNVPTQSIGKFQVSGNTTVGLQPTNGVNALTIATVAADALTVSANSKLNIILADGATNLNINVTTGAKGSISGAMTFSTNNATTAIGSYTLTAADASGITFNSGATFTQNCSGNVFGSGTVNSVVLAAGSKFIQQSGGNPFQKNQPASVVIFQPGSLFSLQGNTTPSISGRTYADFEYNVNLTTSVTAASALVISNLTVLQGIFAISGAGGLYLNGNASVSLGATLNLNNNVNTTSGKTVTINGILGGTATFSGNAALTISSTGTLAPGTTATIGALTLATAPILNGTNYLKIDRNGGAPLADKIALASGTLNYGGTLIVTNIGAALQPGDTFTNFSATSFTGWFGNLQLPAGYSWNTNNLLVNGTISIASIAPPAISSFAAAGTNIVLNATNGTPNGPVTVLTSTNLTLPVAQWTTNTVNSFDGSGNFNYTNAGGFSSSTPQQFYILKTQ